MSEYLRPGLVMVNPDGTPSRDYIRVFNSLVDQAGGQGRDFIGETKTQSANTTVTTNKIVAGTQELAAVQLTGKGNVANILDAQAANITAATKAGSGSSLIATVSPNEATGSENDSGAVTVTTNSVIVTAEGGTSPYTCSIAKQNPSDPDIPPSNATPTAGGAGLDEFTVTFSASCDAFEYRSAIYCFTVTDDASATFDVCVPVSVLNLGGDEE